MSIKKCQNCRYYVVWGLIINGCRMWGILMWPKRVPWVDSELLSLSSWFQVSAREMYNMSVIVLFNYLAVLSKKKISSWWKDITLQEKFFMLIMIMCCVRCFGDRYIVQEKSKVIREGTWWEDKNNNSGAVRPLTEREKQFSSWKDAAEEHQHPLGKVLRADPALMQSRPSIEVRSLPESRRRVTSKEGWFGAVPETEGRTTCS